MDWHYHRSKIDRSVLSGIVLLSVIFGAVPATAGEIVSFDFQSMDAACAVAANGASEPSPVTRVAVQSAKSAAILGGQPSAFDLIRATQESAPVAVAESVATVSLAPAIGGPRSESGACTGRPTTVPATSSNSTDFLESKRLTVSRTAFDRDWHRVSRERVSAQRFRRLVGGQSVDGFSTLKSVNSWVNHAISFAEDRDLFARDDYWAGAARTLKLRRGDCEDIALTKMQLLAAAGIPRDDMILTIARDLVRNADHALLIVRYDGRYYMLDNASDELFDASLSHDYRPILSFSGGQAWLHGY